MTARLASAPFWSSEFSSRLAAGPRLNAIPNELPFCAGFAGATPEALKKLQSQGLPEMVILAMFRAKKSSAPLHKESNCRDDNRDQYRDLNHIRYCHVLYLQTRPDQGGDA